MQELEKQVQAIRILGDFVGMRELSALTREAMRQEQGMEQVDVLILFGGTIPAGIDTAAEAMQAGLARRLMIVGGQGHTTETLRQKLHRAYPMLETAGRMEAEILNECLRLRHGLTADWLECASTNCGNNVTNALALLHAQGCTPRSMLLMQDATMQRRMDAGFRKFAPDVRILNYATYHVEPVATAQGIALQPNPWGMWDVQRYVTLLLGEIPRLRDGAQGYGPRGKDYIAHVDIPAEVEEAFAYLSEAGIAEVRTADARWASK